MQISIQSARWLLAGASALAMAMSPTLAIAQEQGAQEQGEPEPGEEGAGQLPTIIVSATRRANDVQDVPIAVTAISAEALDRAGVADITTLDTVVPSFNLNASGTTTGGMTLRIRGIGTTGNNAGLESAVGVFLEIAVGPHIRQRAQRGIDIVFGRNTPCFERGIELTVVGPAAV